MRATRGGRRGRTGVYRRKFALAALVAGCVLLAAGAHYLAPRQTPSPSPEAAPERIVSLAPSITEILFALNLGDRVAAVTDYCKYPPETAAKPKVGGLNDLNFEAVLRLRPDLVILLPSNLKAMEKLSAAGVRYAQADTDTMPGIREAIRRIGADCGAEARARELLAGIDARVAAVAARVKGLPPCRVLVCVSRETGAGGPESIYLAGKRTYYNDLIRCAGGENAYADELVQYPLIGREGLLRLDPDVIVEVRTDAAAGDAEKLAADWHAVRGLRAAAAGRVFVFTEDYVTIPGPRFVLLLKKLARVMHPEAGWSE